MRHWQRCIALLVKLEVFAAPYSPSFRLNQRHVHLYLDVI